MMPSRTLSAFDEDGSPRSEIRRSKLTSSIAESSSHVRSSAIEGVESGEGFVGELELDTAYTRRPGTKSSNARG